MTAAAGRTKNLNYRARLGPKSTSYLRWNGPTQGEMPVGVLLSQYSQKVYLDIQGPLNLEITRHLLRGSVPSIM